MKIMTDIVERLRDERASAVFDSELALLAADEIERLRAELRTSKRTTWMIVWSNGGYTLERSDMESYPGDAAAMMEWTADPATGDVIFRAHAQEGP